MVLNDETKKANQNIKVRTAFGKWMVDQLDACNMSIAELAQELGLSRQLVGMRVNGTARPTMIFVLACCHVFKLGPEGSQSYYKDILRLTEQEL